MIELSRDAPGSAACGRSGLPLLAKCPAGHRRTVPFRRLRTGPGDQSPLYGRAFECKECGSHEVTLSAIESQAELDEIRASMPRASIRGGPPSSYLPDPDADPL